MLDNRGPQQDPYRVLGISRSASKQQIRRAYLALAKQHHPDRGGDAARFDDITKAWNQLSALDFTPPPKVSRPKRPKPAPKPRSGPAPVLYIPPLSEAPTTMRHRSLPAVDSLLAQQVVHGKIPGGFFARKQHNLHARLSEVLTRRLHGALPAVRIFHGVKIARGVVLDTVVLGGTKVAVLGAQFAPPDVYHFNGSALVGRRRIELPDLTRAVAGLHKLLPDFEVGGFAVIFSDNPHAPTIQATDNLNTLGLHDVPASIMDAVRNIKLFIGTGRPNVVDRAAMGQLSRRL